VRSRGCDASFRSSGCSVAAIRAPRTGLSLRRSSRPPVQSVGRSETRWTGVLRRSRVRRDQLRAREPPAARSGCRCPLRPPPAMQPRAQQRRLRGVPRRSARRQERPQAICPDTRRCRRPSSRGWYALLHEAVARSGILAAVLVATTTAMKTPSTFVALASDSGRRIPSVGNFAAPRRAAPTVPGPRRVNVTHPVRVSPTGGACD